MAVSAHLGHWYVQIAFAVPSLILIAAMLRDSRRRKRERAGRAPAEGAARSEAAPEDRTRP